MDWAYEQVRNEVDLMMNTKAYVSAFPDRTERKNAIYEELADKYETLVSDTKVVLAVIDSEWAAL